MNSEICPSCGGTKLELRESRERQDGYRRRRWVCYRCKHRWSVYYKGDQEVPPPKRCRVGNSSSKRLKPEEIKQILELGGTMPHGKIGALFGVSRTSVQLILKGRSNRAFSESLGYEFSEKEAPVGERRTCGVCAHSRVIGVDVWVCSLGFPDVELHGAWFARDCSCFTRVDMQALQEESATP